MDMGIKTGHECRSKYVDSGLLDLETWEYESMLYAVLV